MSDCAAAGLVLASAGWSVFPCWWPQKDGDSLVCACPNGAKCSSPGKHPRTNRGLHDATTNPAYIKRWYQLWHPANLAVSCGASNIFVVDVDARKGGKAPAGLPETLTARTGGGGLHLVYWQPKEGERIRNRANLWPGVDIRGDGGYVLVDPSRHISGGKYEWIGGFDVSKIAVAPDWLLDKCRTSATGQSLGGAGTGGVAGLSRNTMSFLLTGAIEGERNHRLFSAACDMAGCGLSRSDAESRLVTVAERCGLDPKEIVQTIESAYGQTRTPARPEGGSTGVAGQDFDPITGEIWYLSPGAKPPVSEKVSGQDSSEEDIGGKVMDAAIAEAASSARPRIVNCIRLPRDIEGPDGKKKTTWFFVAQPSAVIIRQILEGCKGWPKTLNGVPFVSLSSEFDAVPHFLHSVPEFWGWLHERANVFWVGPDKPCEDPVSRDPVSPCAKNELLAAFAQSTTPDRVIAASNMPHHPPIPGWYYGTPQLPPPDDAVLDGFIAMFNPETPADAGLIEAAILSLFWGGPPGARPMFLLSSAYGMGAGKTATARAIALLVGGETMVPLQDSWVETCKQIASEPRGFSRALLFDNIKGKFEGSALEAAVTARQLSGWKAYHGTISVPNVSCLFVTANMPELSKDIAERSVIIRIGAPRHHVAFLAEAQRYVDKHRAVIISTIIARLAAKTKDGNTVGKAHDRWQDWQRGCLEKCRHGGGAAVLAALIASRQPAADYEGDERQDLMEAIQRHAAGTVALNAEAAEIDGAVLYDIAVKAGAFSPDRNQPDRINRQKCLNRVLRLCTPRIMADANKDRRIWITLTDGSKIRARYYRVDMREWWALNQDDDGPPV